jgi:hypothetical protein
LECRVTKIPLLTKKKKKPLASSPIIDEIQEPSLPETTPESSPAVSVLPLSLSSGREPKPEKTEKTQPEKTPRFRREPARDFAGEDAEA